MFNRSTCSNVPITLTYLVTNTDLVDPNETITAVIGESGANLLAGKNVTLLPNQSTTVTETITLDTCNGAKLDFNATAYAVAGSGSSGATSGASSTDTTPFALTIPPATPTVKVMVSETGLLGC